MTSGTLSSSSAVAGIRKQLESHGLDAFIIPSTDAHMSEYTAARDHRRAYVSNFSGSAGTALVTRDRALMWTDGRYYLQATNEMFTGWELMRATDAGVPPPEEWCAKNLPPGSRVGFDPDVTSVSTVRQYAAAFTGPAAGKSDAETTGAKRAREPTSVVAAPQFVDMVWADQPAAPVSQAMVQHEKWSGESVESKLKTVRGELAGEGADAVVICALDEIMWLCNIRGADVPYNPVLFAYCIVSATECTLFIDAAKLDQEVRGHLEGNGIVIRPYTDVFDTLRERHPSAERRVWLDPARSNAALWLRCLPGALPEVGPPGIAALRLHA